MDQGMRRGILKNKNIPHIATYPHSPKSRVVITSLPFNHKLSDKFNTRPRDEQGIATNVFRKQSI